MDIKNIIKSQYWAALDMLRQAIEFCPPSLWNSEEPKNIYWHTAHHVLFFTHFYLHPKQADYLPWEKHNEEIIGLSKREEVLKLDPFSQKELLEYLSHCLSAVDKFVDRMDLDTESGFDWLPFSKLELQFYNIRHIQQHTGEMYRLLENQPGVEVGWVGMKPNPESQK